VTTKSLTIEIRGDAKDFTVAVKDAEEAVGDFEGKVDGGNRTLGGFGDKLKGLGSVASTGFLAVGAAAVAGMAIVADQISKAFDVEAANDKLAAQLGAPPEMAAEFGAMAGRLYSQNYGENLGEVNEALKRVWQDGLVDEDAATSEIEGVTSKVMDLASAFDQDLGGVTKAVSNMLRTGLAGSAEEAFDILTRGFQQGNDKSEDLLDTVNEYSTQFRQLGLSGNDAMGLISQGLKGGARDADLVADAMKEFAIRAQDGSDSTAESFKQLGLDGAAMSAAIAKGGPEARAALDATLDKLREVKDPAEQAQIAVGLFGTQSEDLQDALYALDPSKAAAAMGDVAGAADEMGKTLNDNGAAKLESFKRSLQTNVTDFVASTVIPGLANFGEAFSGAMSPDGWESDGSALENIAVTAGEVVKALRDGIPPTLDFLRQKWDEWGPTVMGIVQTVGDVIGQVFGFVQEVISGIANYFAENETKMAETGAKLSGLFETIGGVIRTLGEVAGMIIGWISETWRTHGDTILGHLQGIFNGIVTALQGVFNIIGGIFNVFKSLFTGDWEGMWNGIKQIFGGIWDLIVGIFSAAWHGILNQITIIGSLIQNAFSGTWDGIKRAAGAAWDWIVDKINGVLDFFKGIPEKVGGFFSGIWDGLKSGLVSALNWVIDKLNSFSVSIPDWVPGLGGKTWSLGIPRLHTGGTFWSGNASGEGFALLRDGERIHTPASVLDAQPAPSGPSHITRPLQIVVGDRVIKELIVDVLHEDQVAGV
jgi:phage-related minor tail protein